LGEPLYDLAKIQRLLKELGFPSGKIDGKIGTKTKTAIRDYQRQAGLFVTGAASLNLQKSLQRSRKQRRSSSNPSQPDNDNFGEAATQQDNRDLSDLDSLD